MVTIETSKTSEKPDFAKVADSTSRLSTNKQPENEAEA